MIVKFPGIRDSTTYANISSFKTEISRIAAVNDISISTDIPGQLLNKNSIRKKGTEKEENIMTFLTCVDCEHFNTYQMKLSAGRFFQLNDSTDIYRSNNIRVMVNEKLAETLGFENQEEAIGASVVVNYAAKDRDATIIGVLKNIHQRSLKEDYEPILYFYPTYKIWNYFSVNMNTNLLTKTITDIETEYKRIFPGNPIDYFFLDEYFDQQYRADQQFQKVFGVFSILAIVVACLGLFGLSTLMMAQRTKEISIRKVLGANISAIVILLSSEFMRLAIISCIIASPFILLWAKNWLNNFAFRININLMIFIIPTILLLLISIMTIGFQIIKAAIENPVNALKHEG